MGTSSERVFNGSGRGYLPAGTIGNRTHIPVSYTHLDLYKRQQETLELVNAMSELVEEDQLATNPAEAY